MRRKKILILDIEMKPILANVWRIFDENIGINQIQSDKSILSWAAKWIDQPKIYYRDLRKEKNIDDDSPILQDLWELMDEAETLVGHNLNKFDRKNIQTRFLKHGMRPTNKTELHDTLSMAKSQFSFTSNKLEYIASFLGVGEKSHHKKFQGFELWRECMNGNPKAWAEMKRYNQNDVVITEAVYKKLLPYCKLPTAFIELEEDENPVCSCGSDRLHSNGYRVASGIKYKRLRCLDCGANYRLKQNLIPTRERKRLIIKE
jgi:hypothetical protein